MWTSFSHGSGNALRRQISRPRSNIPTLGLHIWRSRQISSLPLSRYPPAASTYPIETEAYVVHEPQGKFTLEKIYLEEPRDDELLVEMRYSGICHTDLIMQQGLLPWLQFPAVLGHEGAGIIRSIGKSVKNKKLKIGDSVLLSFNTCGSCDPCLDDQLAYCHNHAKVNHSAVRISDSSSPARLSDGRSLRSQYFGQSSFSRHSIVSEKSVIQCESDSDLSVYAPIGCGYQTGAGTVLNLLRPKPSDIMVVIGLGGVGLTSILTAKYLGVKNILAVDLQDAKLQLAKELGASQVFNPSDYDDIVVALKNAANDRIAFALDCTGIPKVIEQCIEACGPSGIIAGLGVPPVGATTKFDPLHMMLLNKQYIGVVAGGATPSKVVPQLIEMHRNGNFPIEKLRTVYSAMKLDEAIQDLKNGKVIKPVISWT